MDYYAPISCAGEYLTDKDYHGFTSSPFTGGEIDHLKAVDVNNVAVDCELVFAYCRYCS